MWILNRDKVNGTENARQHRGGDGSEKMTAHLKQILDDDKKK